MKKININKIYKFWQIKTNCYKLKSSRMNSLKNKNYIEKKIKEKTGLKGQ
jgi:hypothetical protein